MIQFHGNYNNRRSDYITCRYISANEIWSIDSRLWKKKSIENIYQICMFSVPKIWPNFFIGVTQLWIMENVMHYLHFKFITHINCFAENAPFFFRFLSEFFFSSLKWSKFMLELLMHHGLHWNVISTLRR